jgi:hypothetical protein
MDNHLKSMWDEINAEHFGGTLIAPLDIDFLPLAGEENIEAFGCYFPHPNCIAIDERFRFDIAAVRAGDPVAMARLQASYCLVLHETVHQAQYQKKLPRPGSHGPSFVALATAIAASVGEQPPTEATAGRWPDIAHLIVLHDI